MCSPGPTTGSVGAWASARECLAARRLRQGPLGRSRRASRRARPRLDGDIGHVEGLVIEPLDHHVTHVLLQEGHFWGRKEVAIPIGAVTGIDDGIRLSLTKREVQDLPPVGVQR